eukprot:12091-Heterococcus_DN1.PRE.6
MPSSYSSGVSHYGILCAILCESDSSEAAYPTCQYTRVSILTSCSHYSADHSTYRSAPHLKIRAAMTLTVSCTVAITTLFTADASVCCIGVAASCEYIAHQQRCTCMRMAALHSRLLATRTSCCSGVMYIMLHHAT